jgi:hypothetical protein
MVSATSDVLHADALHESGQVAHALGGDLTLVGTADRARHGAAHEDARRARRRHHRRKALDALGDRTVDVALAEGLARRAEDHNFVRLGLQRRLEAGHVRRQHRVAHAALALDARHDLGVVRHLRHPFRRHEARDLDLCQTGRLKPVHELDLDGRRHWLLFVLKAVARADIDQFDAGRDVHFGFLKARSARRCPQ